MRDYLTLKLRGVELFAPFIAAWSFLAVVSAAYGYLIPRHLSPDPLLDWNFGAVILFTMLFFICLQAALCFAAYFFVKHTMNGISVSGERLQTDYPPGIYAAVCMKGILLSALTCGVYLPWYIRNVARYFAAGTYFRFNAMEFRGNASLLFSYAVLFLITPAFITWLLMPAAKAGVPEGNLWAYALIVSGLMAFLALSCFFKAVALKWFSDFAYDGKRIISTACGWRSACFIFGQSLITLLTLGLYYPMALLKVWNYYACRLVIGESIIEKRFGFTMRPRHDYFFVLGQMLLSAVTLGVYIPWAYAKVTSLLVGKTYAVSVEAGLCETMPAEYR